VKSLARGDSPAEAQLDAPWRNYTTLPVHLEATYPRTRIDWWILLLHDAPGTRVAGALLFVLLVDGLLWALLRWRQLIRPT
jgi:hypothetical protein